MRDRAARAEALDLLRVETELLEDLVVVLSEIRTPFCRYFGDALYLDGTADRGGHLAAGAFDRNDDLVRSQLRIVDHFLRPAHGAERDMDGAENLGPMRHRLRAEDLVENGGQLGHVRPQLRRIGESRIRQQIGASDGFGHGGEFVRRDKEDEPGAVGCLIHVQRRICGVLAIVQPVEFRPAQRALDGHARGPDAFGE